MATSIILPIISDFSAASFNAVMSFKVSLIGSTIPSPTNFVTFLKKLVNLFRSMLTRALFPNHAVSLNATSIEVFNDPNMLATLLRAFSISPRAVAAVLTASTFERF